MFEKIISKAKKANSKQSNPDNKIYEDYIIRQKYIQSRLEKVRQLYNYETDEDKLEALIYEEKALTINLNHLIKTAKEQGIHIDNYSFLWGKK